MLGHREQRESKGMVIKRVNVWLAHSIFVVCNFTLDFFFHFE